MYLLMPLHMHYDHGFGMTADQFKESADELMESDSSKDLLMPINFLKRHSLELYLKSLIYILHRKFDIPFFNNGSMEKPFIQINKKQKLLTDLHNIGELYYYFIGLHQGFIDKFPNDTDWLIEEEIDRKINLINGIDSKSTFFRYPKGGDNKQDEKKSRVKALDIDKIQERMQKKPTSYVKAMLLYDENDMLIQSFDIDTDVLPDLQKNLTYLCNYFHDLHAAYRFAICKGQ